MDKTSQALDELFEKRLRRFQKLSLTMLFPSLISFFSGVMGLFNKDLAYEAIRLGVANRADLYFLSLTDTVLGNCLSVLLGLVLVAVFASFSLLASKGKLWATIAGTVLYLADSIYCCFCFRSDVLAFVFLLIIHVGFLALQVLMLISYFQANQTLQALTIREASKKNKQ